MSGNGLLFWLSSLLLGYTYLGYPVLIWMWATLRCRPPRLGRVEPAVTLLVVAHNEAARIAERLENLLSLDYPRERVEIVLASDGSTDGTVDRARKYEQAGVRVVAFATRRGKSAVLNDLVPKARGEIVVLSDARQRFEAGALRALVAPFNDLDVGTVAGELILSENGGGSGIGEGARFYWRYEMFIRRNEGLADSTVGADGPIYAIRRDLFKPVPEDTLAEDLLIPMRIARQGYRVFFEPRARASDRVAATARDEFNRKVRTIAGGFQLFARERWLLHPWRNRLWLQTISHKGLRLLTPVFLATMLGTNFLLLDQRFYRWTLVGQIVFYAAALGGCVLRNERSTIPFLNIPYVLCLLSWAAVVGFVRFLSGRQPVTWERASA